MVFKSRSGMIKIMAINVQLGCQLLTFAVFESFSVVFIVTACHFGRLLHRISSAFHKLHDAKVEGNPFEVPVKIQSIQDVLDTCCL